MREYRGAEHQKTEDQAHRHQRLATVACDRNAEAGDSVRDGLEPGERHPTVRKRFEDVEDAEPHEPPLRRTAYGISDRGSARKGLRVQSAERRFDETGDDHQRE